MSEIDPIEHEIIEKTGFTPEKKYRKRQDYLMVLLRKVVEMPDDAYDTLSNDAINWSHKAADAHRIAKEKGIDPVLPDFNGVDEEPNGDDEEHYENGDDGEVTEAENEPETETEVEASSEVSEDKPKKERKKRKAKVKSKAKSTAPKKAPGQHDPVRGVNAWGVVNGTKSDLVCRMLAQENGTTMKDITLATGQAHYNLVHRLQRNGFTIIKNGLNLRLIEKE